MKNQIQEILEQTLGEMAETFSSTEFSRALYEKNVDEKIVRNRIASGFLMSNCEQVSKKIWRKREGNQAAELFSIQEQEINEFDKIVTDNCIAHLKSLGYKVYAPVTEFKEL
jgi:hypothetical protein